MKTIQKIFSQKKIWCCVIVAQLLFLATAGCLYDHRERLDIVYNQEDLVDDAGGGGAFM